MRFLFGSQTTLAIHFGSSNTSVFDPDHGVILREPTLAAIDLRNNKPLALGFDARLAMSQRVDDAVESVQPVRNGVIEDLSVARAFFKHILRKSVPGVFRRPRVLIDIPSDSTALERRTFIQAARSAGASATYLVPKATVAALGAGLPIHQRQATLVVHVGATGSEVAVHYAGEVLCSDCIQVGGRAMDEAIVQYFRRRFDLLVSPRSAERLKIEIGSAWPVDEEIAVEVKGKGTVEALPRCITVTSAEIREALAEKLAAIDTTILSVLQQTPLDRSTELLDTGIVLSGGGALLAGFPERVQEVTGIPATLAEDPLAGILLGHGKYMHLFDLATGRLKPSTADDSSDSLDQAAEQATRSRLLKSSFYSCFLSYSHADGAFVEKLYDDLQAVGVDCFFAPKDMAIGARTRPALDEGIRKHDRLLLVLSESSIRSQWVQQEVETALAKERESAETVLFPVRIDDAVLEYKGDWPGLIKNTRNIGDFTRWQDPKAYRGNLERLLRDLRQ